MMRKKKVLLYFEKEWKGLYSGLKAYYEARTPEALHQFRIQIKKLRALIILLESDGEKRPLTRRFKPLRRIFKKAGVIRDAYLHEQLTREMKLGGTGIIKEQREIQEKAGREFNAEKDKFFKELKESHKSLVKRLLPLNDIHVNQYYDHVLQQIALIIAKPQFDEEMHDCRKLIKILIYNNKLIRPLINPALNEDYLKNIETAIGEWHNLAMALEFFARHDIRDRPGILELKKQDRKRKAEIRKLGKDFYQRARLTMSGIE